MSSHFGSASLQDFWQQNGYAIETLALYAGGILLYALLVNFFYQIISKRVMFGGKGEPGQRRVGGPFNGFLYLMMFPLLSFAFFLLLSMSLIFLGGEGQSPELTFTLGMAVVLAVRVASYFNEATSHDVAKMLPLGLLGVILVNAQFNDFVGSLRRLEAIWEHADLVLLYFGVVVVVEYMLRTIYLAAQAVRSKEQPTRPPRPPRPSGAHGMEPRER